MLDLIELYLRSYRYDVKKAQGALEALYYIDREIFNIILLDIMMHEVDSCEFNKEVRRFSDVTIIMVTARDQTEDIVKGLKMGADDYITKPFNEAELLARMDALLRRVYPGSQVEINGLRWDKEQFELT